jgi:carboxyl-terminal processing protease
MNRRLVFLSFGMMLVGSALTVGLETAAHGAGGTPAVSAGNSDVYHQFNLFSEAFEKVRANYVRPVEDSELIDSAIEGMVSGLDPHSSYMTAKQFSDFQVQATGEFGGIGIEVLPDDGIIKVVSPIDDTPAAKAGLKPGDYIAAIDGVSIQGLPYDQTIDKMRGAPGTKVILTILRNGEKKPFDVTLVRAIIRVERVKWHAEGDIAYIRLTGFNEQTDNDLKKAIEDLKKKIGPKLKGYVIDLRNNPGGLLEQAVSVSGEFLGAVEVVSTRGRQPEDTHRYVPVKPVNPTGGKPVVVLINGGSASAAEIVAGALQDHKRATLIGMRSFGKGSVQTVYPLTQSGGALKLTTARYYTPSGRSIQAEGIVPSIAVGQGDEDGLTKLERQSEADLPGHLIGNATTKKKTMVTLPAPGKKYDDFQLAYALDYLRGKKTLATVQKAWND